MECPDHYCWRNVFPNYLIIGTQRGGTSALARSMANHPDVFMAEGKEMHFFDRSYDEGLDSYRSHFADAGNAVAVGEATPEYMYVEEARSRIATDLPGVRLIAILRDPVARAYSAYWHNVRREFETLSFEEALTAEPERLSGRDWWRYRFGYLDRGRYASQLERIDELMPGAAKLVIFNDDLRSHRVATLSRVWEFVGVDPDRGDPEETERSTGKRLLRRLKAAASSSPGYDRSYEPMPTDLRERLVAEMEEDIAAAESLLGVDLARWRTV